MRKIRRVLKTNEIRAALAGIPPGHLRVRVALDLTGKRQTAVAKRVGISQSTLSQIVNGNRPVAADERRPLARALGLDVADLFGQEAA